MTIKEYMENATTHTLSALKKLEENNEKMQNLLNQFKTEE